MAKVSDIFEVIYGTNLELVNCEETDESTGIPFVSRTSKNNGVVGFVKQIDEISPNPGHTISVAGGGSVLSSFYQSIP